jgi:hypothetical protein
VTEINWSYTLQEDSIVALMPAARARLALSGAEVIDAFVLNADATNAATGNINLDDASPADDSYYLSEGQDGLRHQWLVDNASQAVNAGGDALADADVVGALARMGKYAVDPGRVAILCDVSTYLKGFLGDLEGVQTLDLFGPQAVHPDRAACRLSRHPDRRLGQRTADGGGREGRRYRQHAGADHGRQPDHVVRRFPAEPAGRGGPGRAQAAIHHGCQLAGGAGCLWYPRKCDTHSGCVQHPGVGLRLGGAPNSGTPPPTT